MAKKKSPCIRAKLKKLFFTEEKKQFLKAKKTNYLLNSDIIRQTSDINMCIDLQLKPTVWWFICFLQEKKKEKEKKKEAKINQKLQQQIFEKLKQ